jgi:hypothetical protein
MTKKLKPVHPGEILREEFMLPLRLLFKPSGSTHASSESCVLRNCRTN